MREAAPIAGRYELVEQLDAGGMGQVWRGYDAVLDREVAVKLIRPDVITSAEQAAEFAKRFRREARVTARIAHHGVPQVYDAVLDQSYDRVYLVMEHPCPGLRTTDTGAQVGQVSGTPAQTDRGPIPLLRQFAPCIPSPGECQPGRREHGDRGASGTERYGGAGRGLVTVRCGGD